MSGAPPPAMLAETIVEDERWADVDLPALAERAARAALEHAGLDPGEWTIAVLGCDDARMGDLNSRFRGRSGPTNVLSWPSAERAPAAAGAPPAAPAAGSPELGDIAIAFETCAREAQAAGTSLANHALRLIVHATLHLLGFDHERGPDAELMERGENCILAKLGIDGAE